MEVTLAHTDSYTQELPVASVTWTHPIGRSIGSASVRVNRSDPAFSPTYIREDGGSRLVIRHKTLGDWEGVITDPIFDERGATLNAEHITRILGQRLVSENQNFEGCSAGTIAYQAAFQGLGGAFQLGGFGGGHIVQNYQFSGQSVLSVFTDLLAATGEEWEVTSSAVSWVGLKGSVYETHLVAGGDLFGWERASSIAGLLAEARAGGVRVYAPENAGFGGQSQTGGSASAELLANRFPRVTLKTQITSSHWPYIREGDFLHLHFPRLTFGAITALVRVVQRTFTDDGQQAEFTLSVLTITTSGASFRDIAIQPDGGYRQPSDAVSTVQGLSRSVHRLETTGATPSVASASGRKGVTVRRAADQAINDATPTAISWDTEATDESGFITVTSSTITIPGGLGGIYVATAAIQWQSDIGDVRSFMEFAGTAFTDSFSASAVPRYAPDSDFADRNHQSLTAVFQADEGETVQVTVYQNAGGGRNVQADLVLYRVGP